METLTLRPTELDAGKRVDAWLPSQAEGLSRSAAQRLLEEGRVTLNGKPLAKNYKLTGGETLAVSLPDPEPLDALPQDIPLDVIFEDGDVIVVNKPKGLVVQPLRRGRGPAPRHRPPHRPGHLRPHHRRQE